MLSTSACDCVQATFEQGKPLICPNPDGGCRACWLPRSFTIHRTVPATVCDRVTSTADGAMRNGIAFGLGLLF